MVLTYFQGSSASANSLAELLGLCTSQSNASLLAEAVHDPKTIQSNTGTRFKAECPHAAVLFTTKSALALFGKLLLQGQPIDEIWKRVIHQTFLAPAGIPANYAPGWHQPSVESRIETDDLVLHPARPDALYPIVNVTVLGPQIESSTLTEQHPGGESLQLTTEIDVPVKSEYLELVESKDKDEIEILVNKNCIDEKYTRSLHRPAPLVLTPLYGGLGWANGQQASWQPRQVCQGSVELAGLTAHEVTAGVVAGDESEETRKSEAMLSRQSAYRATATFGGYEQHWTTDTLGTQDTAVTIEGICGASSWNPGTELYYRFPAIERTLLESDTNLFNSAAVPSGSMPDMSLADGGNSCELHTTCVLVFNSFVP